jgi:hypothetical protein
MKYTRNIRFETLETCTYYSSNMFELLLKHRVRSYIPSYANIFDIYMYIGNYFYSQGVVTPICISLHLGCIWSNEMYVDRVYGHTIPSKIVYI